MKVVEERGRREGERRGILPLPSIFHRSRSGISSSSSSLSALGGSCPFLCSFAAFSFSFSFSFWFCCAAVASNHESLYLWERNEEARGGEGEGSLSEALNRNEGKGVPFFFQAVCYLRR